MEKCNIDVYSECPFDKVSMCRITLGYALFEKDPPLQYNYICHSYHSGNRICQKCIAFWATYIYKYGIPEKGQLIKPKLNS